MDAYTQELRDIKRLLVSCLCSDTVNVSSIQKLINEVDNSNHRLAMEYARYAMEVAEVIPTRKDGTK